jgi:hypothetical protein
VLLAHLQVADRALVEIPFVFVDLALLAFPHARPPSERRL